MSHEDTPMAAVELALQLLLALLVVLSVPMGIINIITIISVVATLVSRRRTLKVLLVWIRLQLRRAWSWLVNGRCQNP